MTTAENDYRQKAQSWLAPEFDAETRQEVQTLLDEGNDQELKDRFYKELEFGTGGLRGIIGAGTNRMNSYIVGRTSQGLADYVRENGGENKGIVIAYDSRRFSETFAKRAACVFAGNGIQTYLFPALRPTPALSFAVRHLGTMAGIVITASHNPKEYNGYKVYWSDGGQIVPPHDRSIIDRVNSTSFSAVKTVPFAEAVSKKQITMLDDTVDNAYLDAVGEQIVQPEMCRQYAPQAKIVFTPIHGTGITLVPRALEQMGVTNLIIEPSQQEPDENFPTVDKPNPEESAALTRAVETARQHGADLVLATDPDGDRVGIAVRDPEGGYPLLNGNQIGSILMEYILAKRKEKHTLPPHPVVIKTIVTTELQRAIAAAHGIEMDEVLTGFKYIGEKIRLYEQHGTGDTPAKQFVFGGEESYGYLAGTYARDKDAVVASSLITEVYLYCLSRGITLLDYLDQIYEKYGYYRESLMTVTLTGFEGLERIQRIMSALRQDPPRAIGDYRTVSVWDVSSGKRKQLAEGTDRDVTEPQVPPSNVLVFELSDDMKITVRPSGTEPKIKFYLTVKQEITDALSTVKQRTSDILQRQEKAVSAIIERIA